MLKQFLHPLIAYIVTACLQQIDNAAEAFGACRECTFRYIIGSVVNEIYNSYSLTQELEPKDRLLFKEAMLEYVSLSLDLVDAHEVGASDAIKNQFGSMARVERQMWIDAKRVAGTDPAEAEQMVTDLLAKFSTKKD